MSNPEPISDELKDIAMQCAGYLTRLNAQYVEGKSDIIITGIEAFRRGINLSRMHGALMIPVVRVLLDSAPTDVTGIIDRIVNSRFDETPEDTVEPTQILEWVYEETRTIGEFTMACLVFGIITHAQEEEEVN